MTTSHNGAHYVASYAQTDASDPNPIPDFLDRRGRNYVPPPDHVYAVHRLSDEQAALVWSHLLRRLPENYAPSLDETTPKQRLLGALRAGLTQADAVLSLIRETSPAAEAAIGALVGQPIRKLREKESGLRPAGASPAAPSSQTAAARRAQSADPMDNMIIRLVATGNPRKVGTAAFLRYAKYRDGMTVREYLDAGDTSRGNVRCDVDRGNIRLEQPR